MNTPTQTFFPFAEAANDSDYNVRIYRLKHNSKYLTPEWQRTKGLALMRADWRCENPGCRCRSSKGNWLEAHHIDPVCLYPELFHVLSNIRILCRACHQIETMKQAMKYGWRYAFK